MTRAPRPLTGRPLVEALIDGWRPLARLDVDGFALLRSRGVTRRAHSAVALDAPDSPSGLLRAVERIEGLCAAAGEPATFRILDLHGPAPLDALLAERGYTLEGRSAVQEIALDRAPAPAPAAEIRVGGLNEEWFEAAWRLAPRPGEEARRTLHDILAGTPAVQVLLRPAPGEAPVAVGRAALVETGRERTSVLNQIAVDPAHRRQGLGRDVSRTLLAVAARQGAVRALLEVEEDNRAARALYRGLGSRELGVYHYRVGAAPAEHA